MATRNPTELINTIGSTVMVLIVLAIILGAVYGAAAEILVAPNTATVNTVGSTGDFVEVGDMQLSYGVEAKPSTGQALYFNETDSVESTAPTALNESSWSILISGELDSDTSQNATYDLWAYQNETIVIQFDHGDWSAYYNNTTASALATVPASSPSDNLTAIGVRYNDSTGELTISRAGDAYGSDTMDGSIEARNLSIGWVGRIDEPRTFDSAITNSTIDSYANDRLQPLPNTNRSSRMLFDEGEGDSTHVYFAGSEASISGASWTDGIDTFNLDRGSDYELAENPFRIKLLSSGYMDGAPAVFVRSTSDMWWQTLVGFGSFGAVGLTLIGLGLIAAGAGFAISLFEGVGRGGGR